MLLVLEVVVVGDCARVGAGEVRRRRRRAKKRRGRGRERGGRGGGGVVGMALSCGC